MVMDFFQKAVPNLGIMSFQVSLVESCLAEAGVRRPMNPARPAREGSKVGAGPGRGLGLAWKGSVLEHWPSPGP